MIITNQSKQQYEGIEEKEKHNIYLSSSIQ